MEESRKHVDSGHVPQWEHRRQEFATLVGKGLFALSWRKRSVDEETKRDEMVEK